MEWLSELTNVINTNLDKVIGVLAVLGIAVDLTPVIKIQPIRWLLKMLGRQLNKELVDELSTVKERLDIEEKKLNAHIIGVQRHEILAFSNDCINHVPHTREEFEHIIDIHDQYLNTVSADNIENGRVDLAFKIIEENFLDCISKNSFLKRGD